MQGEFGAGLWVGFLKYLHGGAKSAKIEVLLGKILSNGFLTEQNKLG
jgi:hypothetical protein